MAGNKVDAESLELRELCRENLKFLKLLNQLTLPVTYSDSYYRRIMGASDAEEEPDVCHWNRLAYYRGALVGAISCRVEATTSSSSSSDETNNVHRVYVDIAIGIAPVDSQPKRVLMQAMLDMCRQMGKVVGDPSNTLLHCTIRRKRALQLQVVVRLHVQTSNEDAILFYQRFGFAIVKQVEDYYGVRAEVRSAHLMEMAAVEEVRPFMLFIFSGSRAPMSINSGPYGRVPTVTPPIRGTFPLDHNKICHTDMLKYMCCLQSNKGRNSDCRSFAKQYFQCRMDNGLMDKEEWPRLGFKDDEGEMNAERTGSGS